MGKEANLSGGLLQSGDFRVECVSIVPGKGADGVGCGTADLVCWCVEEGCFGGEDVQSVS